VFAGYFEPSLLEEYGDLDWDGESLEGGIDGVAYFEIHPLSPQ
jgi:hypothetical protein